MQLLDKDRIGAIVVFVFCLSAWSFLDDMPAEAAFFPRAIVGLAWALSVIWGLSTFRKSASHEDVDEDGKARDRRFIENPRNLGIFIACVVAYAVLIDLAGYFTASALFVIGASLLLGYRRPLVVVLTAAGFVAFLYLVFVVIFERPLPIEFFQPR